jgi:hypothetical protein
MPRVAAVRLPPGFTVHGRATPPQAPSRHRPNRSHPGDDVVAKGGSATLPIIDFTRDIAVRLDRRVR